MESNKEERKDVYQSVHILEDEERLLAESGFLNLKMGEKLKPQWRNLNNGGIPTSKIVHRSEFGDPSAGYQNSFPPQIYQLLEQLYFEGPV